MQEAAHGFGKLPTGNLESEKRMMTGYFMYNNKIQYYELRTKKKSKLGVSLLADQVRYNRFLVKEHEKVRGTLEF